MFSFLHLYKIRAHFLLNSRVLILEAEICFQLYCVGYISPGASGLTCWPGPESSGSCRGPCLSSRTPAARWWPSRSPWGGGRGRRSEAAALWDDRPTAHSPVVELPEAPPRHHHGVGGVDQRVELRVIFDITADLKEFRGSKPDEVGTGKMSSIRGKCWSSSEVSDGFNDSGASLSAFQPHYLHFLQMQIRLNCFWK